MTQANSASASPPISLGELVEQLVNFTGGAEAFLVRLLLVQCRAGGASGGVVLVPGKEGMEPVALAPAPAKGQPLPEWIRQAAEPAAQVLASGRLAISHPGGPGGDDVFGQPLRHIIALPLRTGDTVRGVAAFFVRGDADALAHATERLELTASLFSLYEMRLRLRDRETDLQRLSTAMELLEQFNAQKRVIAASMALCNQLAASRQATRVTLGMTHGRFIRARAMSHTEKFTRQMKLVQDIEAAMEECLDQDAEVVFPPLPNSGTVTRATEALSNRQGPSAICSIPLRQAGKVVGVLTVERPLTNPFTAQEVELLRLTGDLVTTRLIDLFDHDRWVGGLLAMRTRRGLAHLLGPEDTWIKAAVLAGLALVVFLVVAKGPYRVEAPFIVDAVNRRSVPAPFDGYLQSVGLSKTGKMLQVGDKVVKGQLLAQLYTDTLTSDLQTAQAERGRFNTDADIARRDGKFAEALVAQFQAREAQARADGLEIKIKQCAITAPFDCTIIAGDWEHDINSKIQSGQVLFEVADVDTLHADLMVPEEQIQDIHAGPDWQGELASAAAPGHYIRFKIDRVNPIAEVLTRRNVFRVRVTLEQPPSAKPGDKPDMKPQMTGLAKINLGSRTYLWIWTHQMVEWARMKLWV